MAIESDFHSAFADRAERSNHHDILMEHRVEDTLGVHVDLHYRPLCNCRPCGDGQARWRHQHDDDLHLDFQHAMFRYDSFDLSIVRASGRCDFSNLIPDHHGKTGNSHAASFVAWLGGSSLCPPPVSIYHVPPQSELLFLGIHPCHHHRRDSKKHQPQ